MCILAALVFSGCFVFDEIDAGQELMETHSSGAAAPGSPAPADSAEGAGKTARQRLAEYYAEQRAKAGPPKQSDDPGDAIGKCRIGSSIKFLRKSDCQLRGGKFE